MNLSNSEWSAVSGHFASELAFVAEVSQPLTRAGRSVVADFTKKFSGRSDRSLSALTAAAALRDACGAPWVSIAAERVCRDLPFSDVTNYEHVRRLRALAYCRLVASDPAAAAEVERYLTFFENGNRPGPVVLVPPIRRRLDGSQLRDRAGLQRPDSPLLRLQASVNQYLQLSVIQALGGSQVWPCERTAEELEWTRGLIRGQALRPCQ